VAMRIRRDGRWTALDYRELAERVHAASIGLRELGVRDGERVAILSENRPEWAITDYACLTARATDVPIYPTLPARQVQYILRDSGAVAAVVSTAAQLEKLRSIREHLPALRHVIAFDADARGPDVLPFDDLLACGRAALDRHPGWRAHALAAAPDDLATLIYTSGTTGRPKGCELTHRNVLSEVRSVTLILPELLNETGSVLLFLPLAHVFGKVIQCGALATRTVVGHTHDIVHLADDLATFRPTFLLAVPRVFEKVFNSARQRAQDAGKSRIFDAAADTAIAWSRARANGRPGPLLAARHALFDRLVYGKLRAGVGGRVLAAVSGSAPLGERLGHFFRGAGLPVLEGYGLTETTAGITVNTLSAQRVGSVGRPVPGHGVRIADDGEVLLSGPIVFRQYWHNDTATAEAFTDGWFHSGDIGALDDAGYLWITGRKKELIVTAGGKNVAPAVLEDRVRANPLISQCMVVGDGKPFIGALITIDAEALPGWRERHGKPAGDGVGDLVDDPELRAEVGAAVADANLAVSRAEQIREFRILSTDFSEAGGELTPTLKVKRAVVARTYADDIAALYAGVAQSA
jgi:long-chain acyl-CoA synthetase